MVDGRQRARCRAVNQQARTTGSGHSRCRNLFGARQLYSSSPSLSGPAILASHSALMVYLHLILAENRVGSYLPIFLSKENDRAISCPKLIRAACGQHIGEAVPISLSPPSDQCWIGPCWHHQSYRGGHLRHPVGCSYVLGNRLYLRDLFAVGLRIGFNEAWQTIGVLKWAWRVNRMGIASLTPVCPDPILYFLAWDLSMMLSYVP